MTPIRLLLPSLVFLTWLALVSRAAGVPPATQWIWHPNDGAAATNGEIRYFRKTFTVAGKVQKAVLAVAADNAAEVYLNEKMALNARGYERATYSDVTAQLRAGENLFSIRGANDDGPGALVVRLEITLANQQKQFVVSDPSWITGTDADRSAVRKFAWENPGNWVAARDVQALGGSAWGDAFKAAQATPAEQLAVLPGFKVELLHSSQPEQGSWICMTVDGRSRLIISPQRDDQPLLRVTLNRDGSVQEFESILAPVRQAMGLCYAHDSLYVNGHGPEGTGLYRLIDANRNDQFETNEVHFLKKFRGEGEHGYHAVVEGPDGMIYVMNGNHTKVPEGIAKESPHQNYQEDHVLPRQWDAGGHAVGVMAPGGYILRTDPQGKSWELLLAGFRNSYDFDFNAAGEIFTFDSDMEWDWGLPWYRPTRVIHCVIGGEYGWRSGSGKWPEYYADSLPATFDVGIGSPTGVKFGTNSRYPEKYRKAFYAMDWSYGRIVAVHLQPSGASYTATAETFVKGKPLNVTDLEFGRDGAMYFITGGRGTQSGLYRIAWTEEPVWPGTTNSRALTLGLPKPADRVATETEAATSVQARALRRQLEAYHGREIPLAIGVAWPHLGSPDRFLRHAARIAIESQELSQWKSRALAEKNPAVALTALLALARCGDRETQNDLLYALQNFSLGSLNEEQQLAKLRILQVSLARQGKPVGLLARDLAERLNAHFPSPGERVNRELVQLLIYLEAPGVIEKSLAQLDRVTTQEDQVHYIFHLRNLKNGWTLEQRRKYFDWFAKARQKGRSEVTYPAGSAYTVWTNQARASKMHPPELVQWFKDVGRDYGDGSSYAKYLVNIRKDAAATLTSSERVALRSVLEESINTEPWNPTMERKFVKEWTMAELQSVLDQASSGRDFKSAKAAFNDAQCIACHRFGNEGGAVGPELTGVGSKYSRRDILESLLDPSKVVSDQYQNTVIVKRDGDDVTGRITDENAERVVILPNMLAPELTIAVPLAEIVRREPSKVSPLPSGLLNNLPKEEILDLLAYLETAGKAGAANFKGGNAAR